MSKLLLENVGKKYIYSARGRDFLSEDDIDGYSYLVHATDYSFRATYNLKSNKWGKEEIVLETILYSDSEENKSKLDEELKKIDKIIESLSKFKLDIKKGAKHYIEHCESKKQNHTCGACSPKY